VRNPRRDLTVARALAVGGLDHLPDVASSKLGQVFVEDLAQLLRGPPEDLVDGAAADGSASGDERGCGDSIGHGADSMCPSLTAGEGVTVEPLTRRRWPARCGCPRRW
jgi:hypothetical protein